MTPSKLIGHFNPAHVMKDTYHPDHFNEGPLMHAMRGGFLFIEEFNRVPADTANVLITAVEEGELTIPRYGSRIEVLAKEGRGMFAYVRTIDEVPPALRHCLAS